MTIPKDSDKRKRIAPALARARQLVARVGVDLRLTSDAARAAGLPDADLAKVARARREISDLSARIEARAKECNKEEPITV